MGFLENVGAFFAADGKDDGTLWAVNINALERSAAVLLKGSMSIHIKRHAENCLNDPNFSFSAQDVFRDIIEQGAFPQGGGVPARVVIPINPVGRFQSNERLRRQQGMFLCQTTLYATFEHSLKNVLRHAKEMDSASEVLYKISIPTQARRHVMRELDRRGFNYANLLPGLDGLAQLVKTRYRMECGRL